MYIHGHDLLDVIEVDEFANARVRQDTDRQVLLLEDGVEPWIAGVDVLMLQHGVSVAQTAVHAVDEPRGGGGVDAVVLAPDLRGQHVVVVPGVAGLRAEGPPFEVVDDDVYVESLEGRPRQGIVENVRKRLVEGGFDGRRSNSEVVQVQQVK